MLIEHLTIKAELNAKKLFLIDGLGAILSAFFLGIVLVKFETIFGIPSSVLYYLASIPIFFAIYDFYCYQKRHLNIGLFLKIIAVLNLIYCCISIGLVFYHFETVTSLGWVYILIEIAIILVLAIIELRVGRKITKE
ncbi:hypothetical protein [Winogradskyella sp. R77965]|uniref:hypothetical protein n=1 Tax=Winogradskyella sp. R77965 TaxID=3093872 RepID=UPI0037DD56C7